MSNNILKWSAKFEHGEKIALPRGRALNTIETEGVNTFEIKLFQREFFEYSIFITEIFSFFFFTLLVLN